MTVNRKEEKRETTREKKAEAAAMIDKKIKAELLERLKKVRMRIIIINRRIII